MWQISYNEIKKEVDYYDKYDELLLPYDWNDNGIRIFLKKRIEKQEEYEKNAEARRLVREEMEVLSYEGYECCYCIHMKKGECEYGIDKYDEDFCEFESR